MYQFTAQPHDAADNYLFELNISTVPTALLLKWSVLRKRFCVQFQQCYRRPLWFPENFAVVTFITGVASDIFATKIIIALFISFLA